jgi:starvation-inducible DNA-binding protein
LRSIAEIARLQTIHDNECESLAVKEMLGELAADNSALARQMLEVHQLCDDGGELATAGLLENWIDETQKRLWFLSETAR